MMNEHFLAAFDSHLERIAVALETLAADASERRAQSQASLVSQLRHLENEARRAWERFGSADKRMLSYDQCNPAPDNMRDYANRCEQDGIAAQAALEAFRAEHPEIVALAEAVPA